MIDRLRALWSAWWPQDDADRRGHTIAYALFFFCGIIALFPLLAASDLPLIDLPSHVGALHIWQNYDDPSFGYAEHYQVNLKLAPYWVSYGFIHAAAWLMPLGVAIKLFIALAILAMPLGLAMLLSANKAPAYLGVVGFLFAWGPFTQWGMLAWLGSIGPLLFAYSLLVRLAGADKPSRRLLAGNIAIGLFLQFSHPMAFLLWLLGFAVYLRSLRAWVVLPTLLMFLWQFASSPGGQPTAQRVILFAGMLKMPLDNLQMFYKSQLAGFMPETWRFWIAVVLVATLAAAFFLSRHEGGVRDRRSLFLTLLLVAAYFALPYHLEKPVGFAGMNMRVPIVLCLVAFTTLAGRSLGRYFAPALCVPTVLLALAMTIVFSGRFARFDEQAQDFRALVERLPRNPAVLTLVYDSREPDMGHPWQKFPCYVLRAKGGYAPCLWEPSQGIGALQFPVGYKDPRPPAPPLNAPQYFSWTSHGAHYDYFLTKDEPANLLAQRPEVFLVEARGAWRLWRKR